MTKLEEIQQAIVRLSPREREELWRWHLDTGEESPAMLAAIDEGIRSAEAEPLIPAGDVRRKVTEWSTRSSSPHAH